MAGPWVGACLDWLCWVNQLNQRQLEGCFAVPCAVHLLACSGVLAMLMGQYDTLVYFASSHFWSSLAKMSAKQVCQQSAMHSTLLGPSPSLLLAGLGRAWGGPCSHNGIAQCTLSGYLHDGVCPTACLGERARPMKGADWGRVSADLFCCELCSQLGVGIYEQLMTPSRILYL